MMTGTLGYVYLEDYSIMHNISISYTLTNTGFGALNESNFRNETVFLRMFDVSWFFLFFAVGICN